MAQDPATPPSDSEATPTTAPSSQPDTLLERITAAGIPIVTMILVLGSALFSALGVGGPKLDIVTSASLDSTKTEWSIDGRVILKDSGRPVKARVWIVAVDGGGNRYAPPDTTTDDVGRFHLGPIPFVLASDSSGITSDVVVTASGPSPVDSTKTLKGEESLRLTKVGRVRWVTTSPWALGTIGLIFFLTIVIGVRQTPETSTRGKKPKYYTLVILSFLFTVTMIVMIAGALRSINATGTPGDVIALGFANIYRGTYVEGVADEWLFSLTAPQAWAPGHVTSGFGVPMWLLLVSVLGAGLFTIALLIKHVKDPVSFTDDRGYRDRIEELVRHQFYLLFAPLGAVLVYQLLVAAGSANVQVTVALAIFAAGAMVNVILDKAVKAVEAVLKSQ